MSTVERKKCDLFWPFLTTPDLSLRKSQLPLLFKPIFTPKFLETIETLSIIQEDTISNKEKKGNRNAQLDVDVTE